MRIIDFAEQSNIELHNSKLFNSEFLGKWHPVSMKFEFKQKGLQDKLETNNFLFRNSLKSKLKLEGLKLLRYLEKLN